MHPLLIWICAGYAFEFVEKGKVFTQSKETAQSLGKPLLNAGCGNLYWKAINESDINLDNTPRNVPNFVLGSVEDMWMFSNKQFGAVFCSHVLEHTEHWEKALSELNRVADYAFIITPLPVWPQAWLHPAHKWMFV